MLAALAAACGGSRGQTTSLDAGATPFVARALPDAAVDDAPDAAPVAAADVLEGAAAETAIAEAMRLDAGATLPLGVTDDQAAGFVLGMTLADAGRLAATPFRKLPTVAGAVREDEAVLSGAAGPWLRLRARAGRLTSIEVLARDGRALTDEGIGVGSSFDEAVLAHGEARAVLDERTGSLRGWVLADLPGVLLVPAGAAIPPRPRPGAPDAGVPDAPAAEARIGRMLVLGPEALAVED